MISHGNRMLRILKHGKIIHTVSKYICPIQFHPEFFQDYIAGSPFTVAFLHNFIGIASAVNCFHIFLDKRKKFLKIAFLICINEHLVINEIISNISNPDYEIQQTLQKVPLTEDYFRKLFFQETGKTPLQYLTQKRISYAKQLLCLQAHSGISIQEIAWRSGFADNYYFSRVFKKVTGVSPKYWAECDKQKAEEDNELPKRNYLPPETKDYE